MVVNASASTLVTCHMARRAGKVHAIREGADWPLCGRNGKGGTPNRFGRGSVDCKDCLAHMGEYTITRSRPAIPQAPQAPQAPPVQAPQAPPVQAPQAPQAPEEFDLLGPAAIASPFCPSAHQRAIFDAIENTAGGNLMVEAVAGSGKTTTLVMALQRIPSHMRVLFLAFNKSIATALKSKVPAGVECRTFHSVGFGALRDLDRDRKVDNTKVSRIIRDNFTEGDFKIYGAVVRGLVSLAKQDGIGLVPVPPKERIPAWHKIIEHHDIVFDVEGSDMNRAIFLARKTLQASQLQTEVIDYDDMLYMSLLEGAPFQKFDVVMVDEAQDTNGIQATIVTRLLAAGGRVVFVGDARQAIYGFRGADSSAMTRLADQFDCTRLPLSVCYRCASSVVEAAKAFCPEIEAAPSAAEGSVTTLSRYSTDTFQADDAIICRNTAPLVSMAYGFLLRGQGVRVLGRDIGRGLIALIETLARKDGSMDTDDLLERLGAWEAREIEKAKKADREHLIESIEDRAECIRIVSESLGEDDRTVEAMIVSIETMFDQKKEGRMVTLCTIHRSKGLEWPRVFILDADLMPSPYATRAWMQEQEKNLHYVAITRAQGVLMYIRSDCWGPNRRRD